ncbi:dihydroxy-acid dehydratase [Paracoccus litorisediminis]|uniref:Dihydroxy-acid dehydratase n=1 Tax=Paracoccus litorisediminis TaxID=2006130 RepID=A0A844HRD4_9RHOB|nr:dihydroxy-acid dehydratase [Paracoccus litorisediminis]MTH60984.1 dihydroxy-acid dehydratase [Paracoccus litorisediminis]
MKLRSDAVTKGVLNTGARALWRATGTKANEFGKPIIAIANSFTQFVPGHVHLRDVAPLVAEEIRAAGGVPKELNTIAVDDGIAMGHQGMMYSLPSRDVIADSVEYMVNAHAADALICLSNCDKITPGMMMAALRLNIPTIFVSGGPMESGKLNYRGKSMRIDAIDTLMVMGDPTVTALEVDTVEEAACPTCGSCAMMGTANSMNCLTEAFGLALPGNGTTLATHKDRERLFRNAARRIVGMAEEYYRDGNSRVLPRAICSREGFENAARLSMAIGGSTNTILHLMAAAQEAGVDWTVEDFNRVSNSTPCLCKVSPNAHEIFVEDMHRAGGVMGVMAELKRAGLLHTGNPAVSADTIGEVVDQWDITRPGNDAAETLFRAGPGGVRTMRPFSQEMRFAELDTDRDAGVIRNTANAFSETGGLSVLYGNIAPDSCVVKSAGVPANLFEFTGPARIFESKDDCVLAINSDQIKPGDCVVIRYEGPRGGPGMQEMLTPTGMIKARGLADKVALITDGRFSGATSGLSIGHISPEAASGGVIALIEEGDQIRISLSDRRVELLVDEAEITRRRDAMSARGALAWQPVARVREVSTALRIYGLMSSSADKGGSRDTERLARLELAAANM